MIYLSGAALTKEETRGMADRYRGRFGAILTPDHGSARERAASYPVWAADNACFNQGDRFDLARFFAWLVARRDYAPSCLFATAPDVVGDAAATLKRSRDVLPVLRALGYRAALVAQDGLENLAIPWDTFDVLFIGGSTEWKLGEAAREIVREAKARGKWVHMGRVNSERRFRYALSIGCDSADGTFLAFGPTKNLPRLAQWLTGATQMQF